VSEGSVFQRADGRWAAKYRDPSGKWRYLYRKSKGEARKALRQALKERDEGVNPTSITVGAFLDSWLVDMRDAVGHRTWLNHEGIVRLHLKPTIGAKRLAKLTSKEVHGLYRTKLAEGLSTGRVRRIHVTLSRALKDAVRWRDVGRKVAAEVTPPKEYRREIRVLTPQQVKQLLDAARGDRLEAAYVLPATCGLRQGRVLGLEVRRHRLRQRNAASQAYGLAQPSVSAQDAAQPTHHHPPEDRPRRAQKALAKR
jgi:site-specific recombinase XerC